MFDSRVPGVVCLLLMSRRKEEEKDVDHLLLYLDDGEDGLDFVFQHFEAAREFAFDFIGSVLVTSG